MKARPLPMESTKIIKNRGLRLAFLAAGFCATGLGVLGIFLPLLPTVPLLLLAALCFARSSQRFYCWLLNHRRLGPMIGGYLGGQGIPLRAKITAIGMIWLAIPFSVFMVSLVWLKVLLILIGLAVSLYLLRLPLSRKGQN